MLEKNIVGSRNI